MLATMFRTLLWRHNGRECVSNHQPYDCLLNCLFRRRSKKTSKFHVTGLFAGNSPGTGDIPVLMASYAENVSIWWRHHDQIPRDLVSNNLFHKWFMGSWLKPGENCLWSNFDWNCPVRPQLCSSDAPLLTWINFNPRMDKYMYILYVHLYLHHTPQQWSFGIHFLSHIFVILFSIFLLHNVDFILLVWKQRNEKQIC